MNNILSFLKDTLPVIKDYFGWTIAVLALLGIGIDFNPWIKINPVRWIFKQISAGISKFLKKIIDESMKCIKEKLIEQDERMTDLVKKLDEQDQKINELIEKLRENDDKYLADRIDNVRWTILAFGNAIKKRDYDKEAYDNIIEKHAWYEQVIAEKGLENGRMDITYEYILKRYKELFFPDFSD
ncbi:MAG: hypothetical protein EOM34_07090 [Clostridia bacterium]|nr:hypothetical protein [Lachnospiraceae bacterium]NCC00432.1 hypothetical protein [Clostridia bacterium]NCD04010.1 hypothetical protein [Clostridia bacterium]